MIIIRSEHVGTSRPSDWVEQIIENLKTNREVVVVGIAQAVFLACTTVKLTMDLTNIGISEVTIDYFELPVLGKFDAIFFRLSKDEKADLESKAKQLDQQMKLDIRPGTESQLVTVPKNAPTTKMALMTLYKLRIFDRIKILGAGGAINPAVSIALMLTSGRLAKKPVAIELIALSAVEGRDEKMKQTTGISIYLARDKVTQYSDHHREILEKLKTGRV